MGSCRTLSYTIMRYFQTDIANRPLAVNGGVVDWEKIGVFAGMLLGVIATEDSAIAEAAKATRGAREIDEAEYRALTEKKTPVASPSSNLLKPAPKVPPPFATIREDGVVGHVVAPEPAKQAEPVMPQLKTPAEYLKVAKVESPDILPKPAKKGRK